MNILIESIIKENSVFQTIAATQIAMNSCAERCRKGIKNNPNYQQQVSVCTSKCKVQSLNKALMALQGLRNSPQISPAVLNSKIRYLTARRDKEIMRFNQYKGKLKTRLSVIPVAQSLKPSPDRTDITKIQ